ncbi:hypothetical protein C2857_003883 [Epichloe festucae Fl1]|uniref:Uncharacterized protein n=1 Tax=Epichloe festucae (strain Fl1) TaxID=877507 RepID=A0A7U3Q250_EPIFF|nr:hypothetical protein C2857_003883 [Epichloe festucae Fl1]
MMLRSLLVGFIPTIILGCLLSCIKASHDAWNDDVDFGPVRQLSHVVPRELPPDYEAPTYGYDYPPPYQYGTSTSASLSVIASSYESLPSTVTNTAIVTTIDQFPYSSNTIISTTDSHTMTSSHTSQSRDDSTSSSSKSWVDSSVLGITGTSSRTTSVGTTYSTANTSAISKSASSIGVSSSLLIPTGYTSTNSSVIASSTSHVNNTLARTMTVTRKVSTFSSKPLPSQSTVTWHPVSHTTSSAPTSPIASTVHLSSGIRTTTSSDTGTTGGPTRYSQTNSWGNSSQTMSSATSSVQSQTVTDGKPRTRTYFSSQWTNDTSSATPNPFLWIHMDKIVNFGHRYLLDQFETNCERTDSKLKMDQQGRLILPGTGSSSKSLAGNTTYHTPWTPSTTPLTTITSNIRSSSRPQSTQQNSSNSSVWSTDLSHKSTSTQRTRFTYQSSSVLPSTGFTSGVLTTSAAPNSTYHWPTTSKSILSSVHPSISSGHSLSSKTLDPGITTMLNSSTVQTSVRTLTSTMRQWPNSTFSLQPSRFSSISSAPSADTSSNSPSSRIGTNTSYVPSTSTLWSETSAQQTTSLITSRWVNSTMSGDPYSPIPATTRTFNESTVTQTPVTTRPTSDVVSSVTTNLSTTSGRTTATSSAADTTSETTLWPTTITSTNKTHDPDQTWSSQPVSTHTRSEVTRTDHSDSMTSTTTASSAPLTTSTHSTRCAYKTIKRSSGLKTQPGTTTNSHTVFTTLKTLISTETGTSEPQASNDPAPTPTERPQTPPKLPNNPNFPWGGDSPTHRHQSVAALGAGVPRGSLWTRWTNKIRNKMRFVRL